ncbi:MAG TPA: DNA/RNA non-specific endonuclease [Pyrinomonadaceae bacterium]|jgi:endonuclease G|nr:DNA/RNA non-specific endonuclease [Pyrinomonadaceae bacterium]
MNLRTKVFAGAFVLVLAALCFNHSPVVNSQTTFTEGFEAGGKTSYAAATVQLTSGQWYLDDALTGNLSTDRKTGSYSARIRNVGAVQMNFNTASAGTVSVQHAVFGTDGASSWALYKSTNNGVSWTQVGASVNTSSTSLVNASFTVNSSVAVRFKVVKLSGGANRLNIDNISITAYASPTPTPTPVLSSSVHLTMGNPTNATADVNQPSNYLMEKPQYALSYHRDNGRANWVSWHLDSTWMGSAPRQDDFRADTTLPAGWYRVQGTDYSGSGFDRGHYCPSADRTSTVADNSATFLMTNMMPQSPDNNQGPWADLENYARTLVNAGNELYIIMGGAGQGGTGSNGGVTMTIANGHVQVPAQTWKVMLVQPQGTNDVARVTTSTRVIAVLMPNTQGIRTNMWEQYRVSVDEVEQLTGYDFFSNVPTSIQAVIESVVDNQ